MKIKKIFFTLALAVMFITPNVSLANDFVGAKKGFGMMNQAEKKIMGDQAHKEMEDLMDQMMSVDTRSVEETEKIANKLAEMTNKYPGAVNMMMSRFVTDNTMDQMMNAINRSGNYSRMGMMGDWGTGWGSFWYWFMFLGTLAWVIAGILVVIWLFKQINKK